MVAEHVVGADVDEHARHLAALAAERQPGDLLDVIDHAGRQIARHQFERFFALALLGQVVEHDGDALCLLRRVFERAELEVEDGGAALRDDGVRLEDRRLILFADGAKLKVEIGDTRQKLVERAVDRLFGRRRPEFARRRG